MMDTFSISVPPTPGLLNFHADGLPPVPDDDSDGLNGEAFPVIDPPPPPPTVAEIVEGEAFPVVDPPKLPGT